MESSLIVTDDFLDNPDAIREAALAVSYDEPVAYKGDTYLGVGIGNQPDLAEAVADVVGFQVDITMSFYRCGRANGTNDTPYWIHADNGCGEFAGVLYLSEPPLNISGMPGTAFWSHRAFGHKAHAGLSSLDVARLNHDANNPAEWRLNTVVGQRYNRLLIYPTTHFHSRYPRTGWGDKPENARLIWAFFFDACNFVRGVNSIHEPAHA